MQNGREIGIGIVGGGYMGKAHAAAMSAVGAVFETRLRPRLADDRRLQPRLCPALRRCVWLCTRRR
jgi:predicted dehydrogenase